MIFFKYWMKEERERRASFGFFFPEWEHGRFFPPPLVLFTSYIILGFSLIVEKNLVMDVAR